MLSITVPESQFYDDATGTFIYIKEQEIFLEHSLIAISKWESKFKKPYLKKAEEKTLEEIYYYIECMCVTKNVPSITFRCLGKKNLALITEYLEDPMTATRISMPKGQSKGRVRAATTLTSEVIYANMFEFGIPMDCEKWHINRLLTLINVCAANNTPGKKMSQKDILAQNDQLNAKRRAKMHSKG